MQANESNGTQPRLLFLLSRFLDGGIDTVLVEYLRHLSQRGCYRLTLIKLGINGNNCLMN